MADANTAVYQFVLPEVGASDDTWGTKLNNDLSKLETLLVSGFTGGTPTDIGVLKANAFGNGPTITGTSPRIAFSETDQVLPEGAWRFLAEGGNFLLQKNTHATTAFASADSIFVVNSVTKAITISGVYGLSFGTSVGTTPQDLTKHLTFHTNGYGFNVTTAPSRMNANVPSNAAFDVYSGTTLITSTTAAKFTVAGEINTYPAGNQIRMKDGSGTAGVGVLMRTDATYLYFMLTDNDNADGSFNALRPLYINKSTGTVGMSNGLSINGNPLTIGTTSKLAFSNIVAPSATDLSQHIELYTGYGFNVTSGNLNYNATSSAFHTFYRGASLVAKIDAAGTAMTAATSIVTQEKGDARYVNFNASGVTNVGPVRIGSIVIAGTPAVAVDDDMISAIATKGITFTSGIDTGFPIVFRRANATALGALEIEGTGSTQPYTIITREKGDARYGTLAASNTFSATNTFTGAAAFNSTAVFALGIDITSAAVTDPNDVEKHIDLNAGLYGFCVSASQLNYNANVGAIHYFWIGGAYAARIEPQGTGVPSVASVITREKGDDRYAQLSAPTFTGSVGTTGNFTILHDTTAGFRMFNAAGTAERGMMYPSGSDIMIRNMVSGVTKASLQIGSNGDISPFIGRFAGDGSGLQSFNVGEVLLASISATGAVGSYALLRYASDVTPATAAAGTGAAGSLLRYANAEGTGSGTPAGNWRLMGYIGSTIGGGRTSLWQRYS